MARASVLRNARGRQEFSHEWNTNARKQALVICNILLTTVGTFFSVLWITGHHQLMNTEYRLVASILCALCVAITEFLIFLNVMFEKDATRHAPKEETDSGPRIKIE